MSNFKNWKDVKKELEEDFTKEDFEEMEIEKQIIRATIEARKNRNITQTELSEKIGIKQPVIARVEKGVHSPSVSTLVKILTPLGYTLKVVPIKNRKVVSSINSKKVNNKTNQ